MTSPSVARGQFIDLSGTWDADVKPWPTCLVTKAEIDAEIERLASIPRPSNGRRRSLIVHPESPDTSRGFTPGIRVALEVLLPGERTSWLQHLGSEIGFSILGRGRLSADGRRLDFVQHDVFAIPSMSVYSIANTGDDIQARLTYTASALLDSLRIPYANLSPEPPADFDPNEIASGTGGDRDPIADEITAMFCDGAVIRTYEALVDPEVVRQRALIWTYAEAAEYLEPQARLGADYRGRMTATLASSVLGRTLGTTNTLTAFQSVLPPNVAHRPHRHTATAINYHIAGHGQSVIGGRKVEWGAGDLLLGAPGMAVHHHGSGDEKVYAFTVQDNAFHLALDSELWQEDLEGEPILIGSQRGYRTNRAEIEQSSELRDAIVEDAVV